MQLLLEASRAKNSRPHPPENRALIRYLLGLSLFGLLLSVYLLYGHYAGYHGALCELGEHLSCNALHRRGFSSIHGIPVAFVGVEWFAILSLLCWATLPEQQPILHALLAAWTAGGALGAVGLAAVEVATGVFCPFCTLAHCTIFGAAYAALRLLRKTEPRPSWSSLWQHLVAYPQVIGSFLLLNAFVLGLFNLQSQSSPGPEWWDAPATTALLQCLQRQRATLYGAAACGPCRQQRALFAKAAGELPMVDCGLPGDAARCKDVASFPTWVMGTKRHAGFLDLEALAQFAGCDVPHRPKTP